MTIELILKVLSILVPVLLLIFLGIFLAHKNVLNSTTNAGLQRYIFTTAMPVMLFYYTSKYSIEQIFNTDYIIATIAVGLITMGISTIIASKFFAPNDKSAFMNGISASFGNSTYIGLVICLFAFGQAGFAPAVVYAVIASFLLIIPILLCRFSEMEKVGMRQYKTLLKNFGWAFISNPLVIGPGLAVIFLLLDITLPETINITLEMIANTAGPMALLSIGASLLFMYKDKTIGNQAYLKEEVSFVVLMKIIFMPALAFLIITPLDIDPIWKSVFILQSAMPVGISSYIICTHEKAFVKRNTLIILYTSALSVITLSTILAIYI